MQNVRLLPDINGRIFWQFFAGRRIGRSTGTRVLSVTMLVVVVVLSIGWSLFQFKLFPAASSEQDTSSKYLFGTLDTANGSIFTALGLSYGTIAKKEHDAGVTVAHIEIAWKDYEKADGVFDEPLMTSQINNITTFLHAGQKVDVQLAVHYAPLWVMQLAQAAYVNQYGVVASQSSVDPNYVFNELVRQKVQDFEMHALRQLSIRVGLNNIWDFRIDGGEQGEALYPPALDTQGNANSYWAYDDNAQGSGHTLPPGVSATPFPGWRPGQRTYHSRPFTTQQVQQWYDWYFNARMNYYNWQINLYRESGFKRYLSIETPGFGTRPDEYATNSDHYLDGSGDPNGTMSRAAVWQDLYPSITEKNNIIAYISSMADSSSKAPYDLCQPGDSSVDFKTDRVVDTWGAVRYISAIAHKYGFLKGGENPGYGAGAGSDYGIAMMDQAASEMASCGLLGMFWAHDERLYTPSATNTITLTDYASIINQYNFNIVRVGTGASYTDSQGQPWSAERGITEAVNSKSATISATSVDTADPTLYRSYRYGTAFQYRFLLTNGNYLVTLKFVGISTGQKSQNVFNVRMNGKVVLEHFDIHAEAPLGTPLAKTFPLTVISNDVNINFTSYVGVATVSAIQITPMTF